MDTFLGDTQLFWQCNVLLFINPSLRFHGARQRSTVVTMTSLSGGGHLPVLAVLEVTGLPFGNAGGKGHPFLAVMLDQNMTTTCFSRFTIMRQKLGRTNGTATFPCSLFI